MGCPDTDSDGWSDPMDESSPNPWNVSQGADLFPADPLRWNQSHVISDSSNSFKADGGLAAGLGLGALIAMMFVMVFGIAIIKLRDNDEYDDYEYEDDDEGEDVNRAAEIARSWQEHGTAPPEPPEGATMAISTGTQVQYEAPPAPTPENTLSASNQALDALSIPSAPTPPSEPMKTSSEDPLMSSIDTNLAMSLLVDDVESESAAEEEVVQEEESENDSDEEETSWDDDEDPWS